MANTSTGISENAAGALCYVLGWISGIVFLIIEPGNKLIKFHAFQSIITFGVITVAIWIFSLIPWVGTFISGLIGIAGFILWVVLMVMAAQGKQYKLPWAGDLAEKWAG